LDRAPGQAEGTPADPASPRCVSQGRPVRKGGSCGVAVGSPSIPGVRHPTARQDARGGLRRITRLGKSAVLESARTRAHRHWPQTAQTEHARPRGAHQHPPPALEVHFNNTGRPHRPRTGGEPTAVTAIAAPQRAPLFSRAPFSTPRREPHLHPRRSRLVRLVSTSTWHPERQATCGGGSRLTTSPPRQPPREANCRCWRAAVERQ